MYFWLLTDNPRSSISGTVFSVVGDGCTSPGSGEMICANVGQQVTISCSANSVDGYTISGPRGTVTNTSFTFNVWIGDYGVYTCTTSNSCGTNTSSISLQPGACKYQMKFTTSNVCTIRSLWILVILSIKGLPCKEFVCVIFLVQNLLV